MSRPVPAPPKTRPVRLLDVPPKLRPITDDEALTWVVGETLMARTDAERIRVAREAGWQRIHVVCLRCREGGVDLHRIREMVEHLAASEHMLADLRVAEPPRVIR